MAESVVIVRMAEMEVVSGDRSLKTVLGSCVGVILRDPVEQRSGLAHIMLPARRHEDDAVGKYADTAIPALLAMLTAQGTEASSVEALLIGGGEMFHMGDGALSIGDKNVAAARKVLRELRIPIVYEEIGGTAGRSLLFSNSSGKAVVRTFSAIATKGDSK
jgi:chemotaxis protein CheD